MKRVEILAPAGSYESMTAAINAGADAIYMGGSRFGARAYADNPEEERLLAAIDEAHLHDCKLYMTVNTLLKEPEMEQLGEFLLTYYQQGVDAVIVQDLGVLAFIKANFPGLPIHASTQMTITGYHGARLLKELGASRVVMARELSLAEIAGIRDHVDIEIESFVHGALCYCYSGQCLLSSFIGGRSGNRGRCAQPCRLPYEVLQDGKMLNKKEERYVLSLKDLCTLELLPDIIEAGVFSLKIEGRMKSPRYTAGVVSVYRKYVDRYLTHGRDGYKVEAGDKAMLLDLFDRGGFTDGYYRQHNGKNMIALHEKPAFREGNQALFDELDRKYIEKKRQEPIYGTVTLEAGKPAKLELHAGSDANSGHSMCRNLSNAVRVTVTGAVVQTAQNQPLTDEKLLKQINKTGNSPFYFAGLETSIIGNCFIPVQALNELRRTGMELLEEEVLKRWRRESPTVMDQTAESAESAMITVTKSAVMPSSAESGEPLTTESQLALHVSLENPDCFKATVSHPDVKSIYIDAAGFAAEIWQTTVAACHQAGKQCVLMLPYIFRTEAEQYFHQHKLQWLAAGFDEVLVRSMEEVDFIKEQGIGTPMVYDAGMYSMNRLAALEMIRSGAGRLTLPLELNSRELKHLGGEGMELIGYGYLAAMVSAQCIVKTTKGCKKIPQLLMMKDRIGKELPVKNHCQFCCNTIYNPSPLSLLGQAALVQQINPAVLRLQFTIETPKQAEQIIAAYAAQFLHGVQEQPPLTLKDFTRGHMKRGVE